MMLAEHSPLTQAVRRLLATLPAEGGIPFSEFRRLFMLLPSSDFMVRPLCTARRPSSIEFSTSALTKCHLRCLRPTRV